MDYKKIAKEILENYTYAGVRSVWDDEKYQIGDYCRESYEWNFEHDCSTYSIDGEEGLKVGGTCATEIETEYFETDDEITELADRIKKAVEFNGIYCGDQVVIAGDYTNNNSWLDENETRIKDAVVIAVIKNQEN